MLKKAVQANFGRFCSTLENLEAKMMWLKNFERIQEIQQQVIWQPITETEPRAFIPEVSSAFSICKFKGALKLRKFLNLVKSCEKF